MAIAFDNAQSLAGGASPNTNSYTTAGTNRALIVLVYNGNDTSDNVSGITYGGVAMTKKSFSAGSGITSGSLWTLLNPASGANNIVTTWSGGGLGRVLAASYTGVDQTLGINVTNTNGAAATTTISNTIVTTVDGVWGVSLIVNANGTATASTNINSARVNTANFSIGDSNGSLGVAGSYTLTWTQTIDFNLVSGAVGLREVVATTNSNFFMFMQ